MSIAKTENKRQIPFDQPFKILILILHSIGFSGWFGGTMIGANVPDLLPALANVSGVLLVLRELYKDGWGWLGSLEEGLMILKSSC